MARRRGPLFSFRWDVFALALGLILISFGTAVGGYVTLGWSFELTSFDIWFVMGIVSLGIAAILAGFNWLLTWATPPLVSGNGVTPLSDVTPIEVHPHGYLIDPKAVLSETRQPMPAGVAVDSMGRDSKGRTVPTMVLPAGGKKGYGIFLHPSGPFFILKGQKPYMEVSDIHRGEFLIIPNNMIPLDPNAVEPSVIDALLSKHDGFNKEAAQFYLQGDWADWFLEYVAYHWNGLEAAIQSHGLIEVKGTATGEPDAAYLRGMWLGALSELSHERLRRRYDQNTITAQSQIISGTTLKQAQVVQRRPVRGQEPSYQEGEERRRGSGLDEFGGGGGGR
jgi:hypothetical protein